MDHPKGAGETGDAQLGFLTTDANANVGANHPKPLAQSMAIEVSFFSAGRSPPLLARIVCAFRDIWPVIPTTSGHLNRGIRPPLFSGCEA